MRVLLVDDSALVRSILKQALEEAGVEIIGQASTGNKAVELVQDLRPDVVVMDINMPLMNGFEATKKIMETNPVPILIFSTEVGAKTAFDALACGAMDVMLKPDMSDLNSIVFMAGLKEKLFSLSKRSTPLQYKATELPQIVSSGGEGFKIIVMGASTGGPMAVKQLLSGLPKDFSLGIALVQHLEEGFDQGYASWLQENTKLTVRLSKEEDYPRPGEVIVAPVGRHLVCRSGVFILEDSEKVLNQKPAVDVLFKSAANTYGNRVLGVLLTGMGRDGAAGCVAIKKAGGKTLVQDEATSAIFGMPKAAIDDGGASEILPLNAFAPRLQAFARVKS